MVPHVTRYWYELGIKLLKEDQESHLDVIKLDHANDAKKCCMEMFWYWLSSSSNASWKELIKALRSPSVELLVVASSLKKTLSGISYIVAWS